MSIFLIFKKMSVMIEVLNLKIMGHQPERQLSPKAWMDSFLHSKKVQTIVDAFEKYKRQPALQQEIFKIMSLMKDGYELVIQKKPSSIHLRERGKDWVFTILSNECAIFFTLHPSLKKNIFRDANRDISAKTRTLSKSLYALEGYVNVTDLAWAVVKSAVAKILEKTSRREESLQAIKA